MLLPRSPLPPAVLMFATLIVGCASVPPVPERVVSTPVEAIPIPNWQAGLTRSMIDPASGERKGYEITAITDEGTLQARSIATGELSGCSWTNTIDWFTPAIGWEGCGEGEWSSGSAKVELVSGEMWPLQAGNEAIYRHTPTSSTGELGTPETRRCEVVGPVGISVVSLGDVDTMKVQCATRLWDGHTETRTWYWTEKYGEVKYRRVHSRDGLLDDAELQPASATN